MKPTLHGVYMKKALLLILAVGIANAVLSAANTTENHRTTASDNAGQYYAADYRLERDTDTPIASVIIRTIEVIPAWLLEAAATAVTDRMSLACTATRFAGSAVTNVRFGS